MKKTLFVLLFLFLLLILTLVGLYWLGTHIPNPTTFRLRDKTFRLTRAYPLKDGVQNKYSEKTSPLPFIVVSRRKPEEGKSLAVLGDELLAQLTKENADILKEENGNPPLVRYDAFDEKKHRYTYIGYAQLDENTIQSIFATWPTQPQETFKQVHKKYAPLLDKKLKELPIYPVRPGQTNPDESLRLSVLKELLPRPYIPPQQKTQDENAPATKKVDENQQQIFLTIMSGSESDVTPWLEEHLVEYDPIFLYAMAHRMATVEKAPATQVLYWATLARLRAAADSSLCLDKQVEQYPKILNEKYIQPLLSLYQEDDLWRDSQRVQEVVQQAGEWDKAYPQQNAPDWMCESEYATSTHETYPPEEWDARRTEFKREYITHLYQE